MRSTSSQNGAKGGLLVSSIYHRNLHEEEEEEEERALCVPYLQSKCHCLSILWFVSKKQIPEVCVYGRNPICNNNNNKPNIFYVSFLSSYFKLHRVLSESTLFLWECESDFILLIYDGYGILSLIRS